VESEQACGTTFTIHLPVAEDSDTSRTAPVALEHVHGIETIL